MSTLDIENMKGLLFPAAKGKCTGAVRIDGEYYEVSNSSGTTENDVKIMNMSFRKLGSKEGSFEVHLKRSNFKNDKAPEFISQEFIVNSLKREVVGWKHEIRSGKSLISLAVNDVVEYEFFL